MFENFTSKFTDFTMSKEDNVNEILKATETAGTVDLKQYLLNDIFLLINKVVMNKLSSDSLFKENYWTWGFVTVYYSNFYMAQVLNRIAGDFFAFVDETYNKNLVYNNGVFVLNKNGENSHKREFKKLKQNYAFLKTKNDDFLEPLFDITNLKTKDEFIKYFSDNEIKETLIRNKLNYQLKHYKESSFTNDTLNRYDRLYNTILDNKKFSPIHLDFFNLIVINQKRMLVLSIIIKELKSVNYAFDLKIKRLYKDIELKYNNEFHSVDSRVKDLIKRLFNEI